MNRLVSHDDECDRISKFSCVDWEFILVPFASAPCVPCLGWLFLLFLLLVRLVIEVIMTVPVPNYWVA